MIELIFLKVLVLVSQVDLKDVLFEEAEKIDMEEIHI